MWDLVCLLGAWRQGQIQEGVPGGPPPTFFIIICKKKKNENWKS